MCLFALTSDAVRALNLFIQTLALYEAFTYFFTYFRHIVPDRITRRPHAFCRYSVVQCLQCDAIVMAFT